MSKTKKPIDPGYFRRYAGRRGSYAKLWREHSPVDMCVDQFRHPAAPRLRNICVLGTATGQVLREFDRGLGIRPHGCEISRWAFERIPKAYRSRIRCEDMREYLEKAEARGKVFDLVFSNSSLVYLPRRELASFLRRVARTTRFLYFNSILETFDWWNVRIKRAGFRELKTDRGASTFLWESKRLDPKAIDLRVGSRGRGER